MHKIYTLNAVPLNSEAIIDYIPSFLPNRHRLMELGFFHGNIIKPLFRSPGGNLTAYEILDSCIAVRNEDAETICVLPAGGCKNV